jgi:hypothetical protein
MNRDFFLPRLTPAKARMMVAASRCANLILTRDIAALAREDKLTLADVPERYEVDEMGLRICQFISDYQHRCVIPYESPDQQIFNAIAAMIPADRKVLFITSDPALWVRTIREKITPFSENNTDRLQFIAVSGLVPSKLVRYARDRYVVANITPDNVCYEWLGKLFPQMIIYCSVDKQYTLPLGGFSKQTSAARHAAEILYPHVLAAFATDRNLKSRGDAILPLMGCFNRLMKNKNRDTESKTLSLED